MLIVENLVNYDFCLPRILHQYWEEVSLANSSQILNTFYLWSLRTLQGDFFGNLLIELTGKSLSFRIMSFKGIGLGLSVTIFPLEDNLLVVEVNNQKRNHRQAEL